MSTECMTPFTVRDKKKNCSIAVPCGKCPNCLKRRVSGWSFRLMIEEKRSISAQFITLTYDTKHVPITRNGFMEIRKSDVQKFIKRLRKSQGHALAIKYYAVGEYGTKSMRPHYHLIIFNASVEHIEKSWQLGAINYGEVSGASIGYTLKYMTKRSKIPMHRNDDRTPEFALMSKGLGENYLTRGMIKWHHDDPVNRMYINIGDGKKAAMPRYYKDKIYSKIERKRIGHFARIEMEKRILELEKLENGYRDKAESDKAAFGKMYHRSTINRNKI